MKIISLNTWGGRAGKDGLLSFFKKHADDTDIFCLQEIWSAPYKDLEGHTAGGIKIDHSKIMVHGLQEISALLSDFVPYFKAQYGDNYGLLTLVRKSIAIEDEGEVYVHKDKEFIPEGDIGHHARNVQFITTTFDEAPLTVMNFHGLWNGLGKGDSEDRIIQSENTKNFIASRKGNIVCCADLNLLPGTKSMQIIESTGLRNLITENGITSTRTSIYTKSEKFADYIFVSKPLLITHFSVLSDEVSDHSPLCLVMEPSSS